MGRARRPVPARRGPAPARPVARPAQRRHHARAVEDDLPGRHRRRLRDGRLHPGQRQEHARHVRRAARLTAGNVEPGRVPPARGLRLRRHAVQLHLHEQSRVRAGRPRQHRRLEAGRERVARRAPVGAAAARGRTARRRHQRRLRGRRRDRVRSPSLTAIWRPVHFTGSTDDVPAHLAHRRGERSLLPQLSAAGRRDRRQGLHPRPPHRRTSTPLPCACVARSLRVPGPEVLGPRPASTRRAAGGRR